MTGAQLRAARQHMNLSQAELAKQIGLTGNTLARKERGETPITVSQARAVRGILSDWYADFLPVDDRGVVRAAVSVIIGEPDL